MTPHTNGEMSVRRERDEEKLSSDHKKDDDVDGKKLSTKLLLRALYVMYLI